MSGLFFVVTVLRKSRTDNFSYIQIDINLIGISNTGINNSYRIWRTEGHRIQNQSANNPLYFNSTMY